MAAAAMFLKNAFCCSSVRPSPRAANADKLLAWAKKVLAEDEASPGLGKGLDKTPENAELGLDVAVLVLILELPRVKVLDGVNDGMIGDRLVGVLVGVLEESLRNCLRSLKVLEAFLFGLSLFGLSPLLVGLDLGDDACTKSIMDAEPFFDLNELEKKL